MFYTISAAVFLLIIGLILIVIMADIAVKNSAILASALGVSNLVIGISLVSIGTDISEIFNSIMSCYLGHGDIDVGDSVGSDLAQLTLIFGLLPIICGTFKVGRKQFLIIGGCEILSLILIFTVVEKGYFTRLDALFMISSFFIYLMVIYNVTKSDLLEKVDMMELAEKLRSKKYHLTLAAIGFLGVAISSYIIIQSIITLASVLNVHEYIISFFILGIGTSLPELAVDINALKKKQYDLAIGDIIGSCIVDSTISIAIGQLLFPQEVTPEFAIPTIIYTICASIVVISVTGYRQIMDKKSGLLFISIYFGSYVLLFSVLVQLN
ncbi:MAG: sodium:calcium antiporter [Promethearchaeota archaeon]|nr:MAG: sodium:calcium antiporter [Candidatus Lokiarchaeota archaeon]